MKGQRLPRVNQLIKKELGEIMLREIDFPEGTLVTLTRVETAANLIEAKVYVSIMPEEKAPDVLATLKKLIYFVQQKLNKRLRMRPVPRIIFVEEKAVREAGKIEELLEEIHKK